MLTVEAYKKNFKKSNEKCLDAELNLQRANKRIEDLEAQRFETEKRIREADISVKKLEAEKLTLQAELRDLKAKLDYIDRSTGLTQSGQISSRRGPSDTSSMTSFHHGYPAVPPQNISSAPTFVPVITTNNSGVSIKPDPGALAAQTPAPDAGAMDWEEIL